MSIISKRKKGNLQEQGYRNLSSKGFKDIIEKKKIMIARWLSNKSSGYKPGNIKIVLTVCCLLFGGLCIYQLGISLYGHRYSDRSIVVTHLKTSTDDPITFPITDSVLQKAERVRIWLDSLRNHDSLKFKAILLAKPFLQENLQFVERLYQSQNK